MKILRKNGTYFFKKKTKKSKGFKLPTINNCAALKAINRFTEPPKMTRNRKKMIESGKLTNASQTKRGPLMTLSQMARNNNNNGTISKKTKFKKPKIVNPEKLQKALNVTVDEFMDAFGAKLGLFTKKRPVRPLHDIDDPKALILFVPDDEESDDFNIDNDDNINDNINGDGSQNNDSNNKDKEKKKNKEKPLKQVHIVCDPKIGHKLRQHQREGVEFVFGCMIGEKNDLGCGCILADGMGIGKTMQSVAVMWTLLTQGKYGKRTCDNGLVLCPASLIQNWANEVYSFFIFYFWLFFFEIHPFFGVFLFFFSKLLSLKI